MTIPAIVMSLSLSMLLAIPISISKVLLDSSIIKFEGLRSRCKTLLLSQACFRASATERQLVKASFSVIGPSLFTLSSAVHPVI